MTCINLASDVLTKLRNQPTIIYNKSPNQPTTDRLNFNNEQEIINQIS